MEVRLGLRPADGPSWHFTIFSREDTPSVGNRPPAVLCVRTNLRHVAN